MSDIVYHGKSQNIFFKGQLYNKRQTLNQYACTKAEYDSLEYPDALTIYTVTYPDNSIKKFIGSDEVDIIEDVYCTAQEYYALTPPDPYTIYTFTEDIDNNIKTRRFLGTREIGISNMIIIQCTQAEYDLANKNAQTLYEISDVTNKVYLGNKLVITYSELTQNDFDDLQVKNNWCLYTIIDASPARRFLGSEEIGNTIKERNVDSMSAYELINPHDEKTVYIVNDNGTIRKFLGDTEIAGVPPTGVYTKYECTRAEYEDIIQKDSYTIYVVTNTNNSVSFYLGNIDLNPKTLISKNIVTNGIYSALDDNADGYSSVTINVPTALTVNSYLYAAPSQNNSTIGMAYDLNSAQPFEIVVCLHINQANTYYVLSAANETDIMYVSMSVIDNVYSLTGQFFWGTHGWDNNRVKIIYPIPSNIYTTDPFYIKVARTIASFSIGYSIDGINFTMSEPGVIPSSAYNFNTGKIYLGGVPNNSSAFPLSCNNINIMKCYIKQNDTLVWGKEIE